MRIYSCVFRTKTIWFRKAFKINILKILTEWESPQTAHLKNVFFVYPKETADVSNNVFLGYFDVSEYVSNNISPTQHLLHTMWDCRKNVVTVKIVYLGLF